MVLGSQATRDGMSRRYMVSRKRRQKRWPFFVLVMLIGGVIAWLALSGESKDEKPNDAQAPSGTQGYVQNTSATYGAVDPANDPDQGMLPSRNTAQNSQPAQQANVFTLGANQVDRGTPNQVQQAGNTVQPYEQQPPVRVNEEIRDMRIGAASNNQPRMQSNVPSPEQYTRGMALIADGKFVEGRRLLSELLFEGRDLLSVADAAEIRSTLESVNDVLIFGSEIDPADKTLTWYKIKGGDALIRIGRKFSVPAEFLMRLNGIKNARSIQAGKSLKAVNGPFHARVSKNDYMLDVYVKDADGAKIFVSSYMVGLGANNSTPVGDWIITPNRKVKNPDWKNPRTGEYYKKGDPRNPIGKYWLPLTGTDANTSQAQSYGIHGTIEPESIGTQSSMGCIRLGDNDIEELFYMLYEGKSTVQIEP